MLSVNIGNLFVVATVITASGIVTLCAQLCIQRLFVATAITACGIVTISNIL